MVQLKKDINSINENNDNYLKEAYYILKYYPENDNQGNNYKFNFFGELIPNNNHTETNSYILKIGNYNYNKNYSDTKYEFTYILNIFERKKILINEIINTIAPIISPSFYSNISFSKRPLKEREYFLKI